MIEEAPSTRGSKSPGGAEEEGVKGIRGKIEEAGSGHSVEP